MLEIKNLHANINGKEILKGINLTVKAGEVHAIMGPNGSGKSTLSNVLVGHPAYEVTKGTVTFDGKDLLALSPADRSHEGLFLYFITLLLTSRESLIYRTVSQLAVQLHNLSLLAHQFQELTGRQSWKSFVLTLFIHGRTHEVHHAHSRNFYRILE